MSGSVLAELYCVGGALLGLWLLVRFPARAPGTLSTAMVALMASLAAIAAIPTILVCLIANAGRLGGLVGLLGLVLPALTGLFWAVGSLFRVFCGLLGRGIR